ncbi:hypothetical protein STRDD10_01668 [Streptococcus sp. DD10]|uniref:AzlD domain-containing protein n=1 Tax=Streptococcus sp. DD10 TaxID=1777878 RepID=UPI000791C0F2|nr:AzlD domain-containing protein [Streptococcus sp. DD10]KXT73002.1 hypothetical protein STRDD10_01668 [Streptococcus sp. DD10]
MTLNGTVLVAILLSALVTWLPRIFPFILVKYKGLPEIVVRFLKYLPISIITALILSSLVEGKVGMFPQLRWLDLLATVPSLYVAFRYKNLLGTVIFGIVLVAILRFIF